MTDLANRLIALRKARGLRLEDVAARLRVTPNTVTLWEQSALTPDTDELLQLSRLYGCTLEELVYGVEEEAEIEILPDPEDQPRQSWFTIYEDETAPPKPQKPPVSRARVTPRPSPAPNANAAGRPAAQPQKPRKPIFKGDLIPYPMLVCMLYCVLGIFLNLWHPAWILFLTIPLYEPLRRLRSDTDKAAALHAFPFPVFVTLIYMCLGVCFNLWHPGWLIYFSVPIYHRMVRAIVT